MNQNTNPFKDPTTIRIVQPTHTGHTSPSTSGTHPAPSPSSPSRSNGVQIAPPLLPIKGNSIRPVGVGATAVGGALPPVVSHVSGGSTTAGSETSSSYPTGPPTGILRTSRSPSHTTEGGGKNGKMTTASGIGNTSGSGGSDVAQAARQQVQRALSGNTLANPSSGGGGGHKSSLSYSGQPVTSPNLTTTSPLSSHPSTRTRRSHSSTSVDSPPTSYGFPLSQGHAMKHPNVVPVGERLKSRHADIVDVWDGTGVGRGMLHHAGPYDAAAPSRNADPKAPMKAFADVAGGNGNDDGRNVTAPPHPSRSFSTDKSPLATPGIEGLVPVLSSTNLGTTTQHHQSGKPSRALSQRAQAALRQGQVTGPGSPSRSGTDSEYKHVPMGGSSGIGSLQGQYSTSLPTSGGYLPPSSSGGGGATNRGSGSSAENHTSGGTGLGTVDETDMLGGGMRMGESGGGFAFGEERRFRERDREQKRRALKAAWGIDEPEPYEQFGYTGGHRTDEPIDLYDQSLPSPNSLSKAHARSPGPRIVPSTSRSATPTDAYGDGGQNVEYFGLKTGNSTGSNGSESPGLGGQKQGGLKRTKSLMHRLKAMRENPNMPPGDADPRAPSPSGPYNEDTLGIRPPNDDLSPGLGPGNLGRTRRNSWLRRGTAGGNGNPSNLPGSPEAHEEVLSDPVYPADSGFQIIESPNKAKPKARSGSGSRELAISAAGRSRSATTGTRTDEKALPPPPVGQVMPDFANSSSWQAEPVERRGSSGVQRKTSIMKKMKDKMAGAGR